MTSAPTTIQPTAEIQIKPGSDLVLVHLSISNRLFQLAMGAPDGNRLGTALLAGMLQRGLESRGVPARQPHFMGALNLSDYFFFPSDYRAALASIRDDLAAHNLLEFSVIAWLDAGEGVLRVFYPTRQQGTLIDQQVFFDCLKREEPFTVAYSELAAGIEQLSKLLNSRKPPGDASAAGK